MQQYKIDFIQFLVESGALKFGEFTLKSGRKCPYFMNFGQFNSGSQVSKLASFYAAAIQEKIKDFDVVFGPAYKGIPLCVAITLQLFEKFGMDLNYSFNRKEAKDHGDAGMIVGKAVTADSKLVIVDDVMTAGTALRDTLKLLDTLGKPAVRGVMIAVDRQERGQGSTSAIQEVKSEFGIDVFSIISLDDILEVLYNKPVNGQVVIDDEKMAKIKAYRAEYGV